MPRLRYKLRSRATAGGGRVYREGSHADMGDALITENGNGIVPETKVTTDTKIDYLVPEQA